MILIPQSIQYSVVVLSLKVPILNTVHININKHCKVLRVLFLVHPDAVSNFAAQQAISFQNLAQLSVISERLNVIEKKGSKKCSDPKKIKVFPKPNPVRWLSWPLCHTLSTSISRGQIYRVSDSTLQFRNRWNRDRKSLQIRILYVPKFKSLRV